MILIIIILFILLCLSIYGNINAIRQLETLVDEYNSQSVQIENFESTNLKLIKLYADLKEIDNKKLFESDDEVGTLFSTIKELILEFEQHTNNAPY
jgi:predicted PurR-regulated permease PerM